jgi:4-amino-4-deoxy-L-arabinose transferase-like glycosyltransferase
MPPAVWLFGGLLLYFALQLVMRVLTAQAVELDEAEQLLWTQDLRMGYGPQPPLYTWLQWAFFQAFGASIFALALLKNLLLLGTYSFTWLAARRLVAPPLAALSSASMLLLMQIVWESQRDLTHSVLVTTAAAATLALLVELLRRPRTGLYLLLGVAVACGLLAKYSFALFVAAFGAALLLTPGTRRVLLDRRLALTTAIAALLVAPHALWVVHHLRDAMSSTAGKLSADHVRGAGQIAHGLMSLAGIGPSFLSPLWVVLALLFGRGLSSHRDGRDPVMAGLFVRYLGLLAALLVATVVLGGAAHFNDRWLQPVLFFAPLMFFVGWPGLMRHPRLPGLAWTAAAMALLTLTLLALRPWYDGQRGHPGDQNLPIENLAQAVRAAGIEPAIVVCDNKHLAGSLRLGFPAARIVHSADASSALPAGPTLLLTYAPRFDALRGQHAEWAAALPTTIEVPYSYAPASAPRMSFAYARVGAPPAGSVNP